MAISGLGWTFDTVAAQYDQWRPGYPDTLFEKIFAYAGVRPGCRALEVGVGTGQATKPFLQAGCTVIGLEPGEHLAALAAQKFAKCPAFSIQNLRFEDYHGDTAAFDVVYSASAFHWVPQQQGYTGVYRMLKPGGVFARFASHSFYRLEGQLELYEDIQRVYAKHMPPADGSVYAPPRRYDEQDAQRRSALAGEYGFTNIQTGIFYRDLVYSAQEYADRLSIESDKLALPPAVRAAFLQDIQAAVTAHGGRITVRDMIDLNLARRP